MKDMSQIKYHKGVSRNGKVKCWKSEGRKHCFPCHLISLGKEGKKKNNASYFSEWVEKIEKKKNESKN